VVHGRNESSPRTAYDVVVSGRRRGAPGIEFLQFGGYSRDEGEVVNVSIANTEMAAAWDEEAANWIKYEDSYERTGVELWPLFLTGVELNESDRVLDLGCGTGGGTRSLAELVPQGSVVGIDLSTRMVAHAREVTARKGVPNIEFVDGDAQVFPFEPDHFDLAVSSFGSMFFADPVAAFTNVGRALRPGGRLALLTWRPIAENEWLVAFRTALALGRDLPAPPTDAPGPFGLANPDHVRRVLAGAGFSDIALDPLDVDLDFGADLDSAYDYVVSMGITRGLTAALDDAGRRRALASLRETLESHETPKGVSIGAAAWRVTARRA
jgi:SAM-dependent methyltransferase